ncbi:MAG: polymerase sigma70 factor [Flaviaesturariibacter sp.]|nr:polymerase sigma70 factor [Flaviaesturariibacter sp.]
MFLVQHPHVRTIFYFYPVPFLTNSTSPATDEELAAQYRQSGDLQVLGALYSRYMDLVYGVCLKYLKEPEDAKDSVLALFEELVTKLQKHEVAQFRPWLYQVARNHCLMKLRSQKGKAGVKIDLSLVQSEESGHLDEGAGKEEQFRVMEYCLEQLPPEQRRMVDLFYLQGKCYNEIAAQTQVEWGRVRSAIQNGRRNLKICMEKQVRKSIV